MSQPSIRETIGQARALERDQQFKEAEELYLGILHQHTAHVEAYERLMIIYRKQKRYKKELAIILQAIKAYLGHAAAHTKTLLTENKKAAALSRKLARQLGLIDKSGKPTGEDDLISKWRRRAELVKKRLDKAG